MLLSSFLFDSKIDHPEDMKKWYEQMLHGWKTGISKDIIPCSSTLGPFPCGNNKTQEGHVISLWYILYRLQCPPSLKGLMGDNMTIERAMNGAVLTPFIAQSYWAVVAETSGDPEDPVGL